MKFIKKSNEPQKLRDFRQNNSGKRWEEFRQQCRSGLNEVYKTLSNDQGGLCAYCEIKVDESNHQVEHFHDKSDESDQENPTRWHLDWNNMLYCCQGGSRKSVDSKDRKQQKENISCGQHKEIGEYQNILSPLEIPMFPRIFSYKIYDGEVWIHADETLCTEAGIDKNRVEQTIEILNLNCKRLLEARHKVYMPIMSVLNEKKPTPDQQKKLAIDFIGNKYENGTWGQFFTMLRFIFKRVADEYLEELRRNSIGISKN
ncbi:MAG: TIGR02646 family protein [Planctomycetaceae bacterium]|nr:TIGR02646 family protein [Planctomycetaceae bacterium]